MSQLDGAEHGFSSLFYSNDLNTQNGSDFLERELGITGMTLSEWIAEEEASPASSSLLPHASPTTSTSISQRDSVDQLRCSHNAVEDKLSDTARQYICTGVSGLVSFIPGYIAYIIDSKICADSSNGAITGCKTVVVFVGTSGVVITSGSMSTFCNDYIQKNDKKCSNQGLSGSRDRMSITVRNTQLPTSCKDYKKGKCIEKSF
jgi:hypothetical protein